VLDSIKKNAGRPFHLLLGNGFSVAYDPAIFSYNALHSFVTKLNDGDLSKVLEVVETRNFEVIMKYLDNFSALLAAFGGDAVLQKRVNAASAKLKMSLLAGRKRDASEHVFTVPGEQSQACATFLKTFLGSAEAYSRPITICSYIGSHARRHTLQHIDGCGRELENDTGEFMEESDQIWSDLKWGKYRDTQNVFYLHGAFSYLIRRRNSQRGIRRLQLPSGEDQRKDEKGEYPIFVTLVMECKS